MGHAHGLGVTIRGRGRPWGEKLKKTEKRTVLVGLRITLDDKTRLRAVLRALKGKAETSMTASTYAYQALLDALERDERRLAKKTRRTPSTR